MGSLVDEVDGVEEPEVVVAISRRFDDLERRVEDVEAGEMVSDDGLMLVALADRLAQMHQQNVELVALLRSALGRD